MDAQDLELKSLKSEIAALRADLANMKEKESKTLKDKDLLEDVLTAALAKLYPEKYENQPLCWLELILFGCPGIQRFLHNLTLHSRLSAI